MIPFCGFFQFRRGALKSIFAVLLVAGFLGDARADSVLLATGHSGLKQTVAEHSSVYPNLKEAIDAVERSKGVPYSHVKVGALELPKYSAASKWRAGVFTPERDRIDAEGYRSGYERKNADLPVHLRSKYAAASGEVDYRVANGRVFRVSAIEARALEFSYLDALNPVNPKDSPAIGLHENPEFIIQLVRQSGARTLLNEGAYIRLDEISTRGLRLSNSEELYRKYGLSNPEYSPKGEWVSDGSIPAANIVASYKFAAQEAVKTLKDLAEDGGGLSPPATGQFVRYSAMNGKRYVGRIASDRVIDDHIVVSYTNSRGEPRYDIAKLGRFFPVKLAAAAKEPFGFDPDELKSLLQSSAPVDAEGIFRVLSRDEELAFLLQAETSLPGGRKVHELLLEQLGTVKAGASKDNHLASLPYVRFPAMTAVNSLSLLVIVNGLAAPWAIADKGLGFQGDYARKVLHVFSQNLGFPESDEFSARKSLADPVFRKSFDLERFTAVHR